MQHEQRERRQGFQQNDPHDPTLSIGARRLAAAQILGRAAWSPRRSRRSLVACSSVAAAASDRAGRRRRPRAAPRQRRQSRDDLGAADDRAAARALGARCAGASCRAGATTASASSWTAFLRSCERPAPAWARRVREGAPGDARSPATQALRDWLQRELRPYRIESLERDRRRARDRLLRAAGRGLALAAQRLSRRRSTRRRPTSRRARRTGRASSSTRCPPRRRACAGARSPGCATGSTRCCCRCRARGGSAFVDERGRSRGARARRLRGRTTTSRTRSVGRWLIEQGELRRERSVVAGDPRLGAPAPATRRRDAAQQPARRLLPRGAAAGPDARAEGCAGRAALARPLDRRRPAERSVRHAGLARHHRAARRPGRCAASSSPRTPDRRSSAPCAPTTSGAGARKREAAGRSDEANAAHVGALARLMTQASAPSGPDAAPSAGGDRRRSAGRLEPDVGRLRGAPARPAEAGCTSCSRSSASAGPDSACSTSAPARAWSRASSRGAARSSAASTSLRGQIAEAMRSAAAEGLAVDFAVAAAEACPFAPASFDAVIASQCWMYFDVERTLRRGAARAEARRRAGDDALQLAAARRPGCPRERGTGAARESRLAGRRLVGPGRRRARHGRKDARACRRCSGSTTTCRSRARAGAAECARAAASPRRCRRARSKRSTAALAAWLDANTPPAFTVRHRVDAHLFDPWPADGGASAGDAAA